MKPQSTQITPHSGRRVGYARVSTDDQDTVAQRDALQRDGCTILYEDIASGAKRARPQLKRCLDSLREGDVLVVHRLDRLARSTLHLLEIIEDLSARKITFRSLRDTFDTSTPQGRLMLTMLAGIAEFERSLIRDRTRAGVAAARERGAKFGNPAFMRKDPIAIALMKSTQSDTYLARTRDESARWRHLVERHRPELAWPVVLRMINHAHYRDRNRLTMPTMLRHVKRLVAAGDIHPAVLGRARTPTNLSPTEVDAASAARDILAENPAMSLRAIGAELEARGIRPVRATTWSAQTVKALIQREDPSRLDKISKTDETMGKIEADQPPRGDKK